MENLQEKVSHAQRKAQLMLLIKSEATVNTLLDLADVWIKQAYIAGANRYMVGKHEHHERFADTGPVAAEAINYSKDKGFKL